MSSLSDEQKARMEENRRKAMEIRAAKLKQQNPPQRSTPTHQTLTSNKRPFTVSQNQSTSFKKSFSNVPSSAPQKFYSSQSPKNVGPELRADLTLISKERFELNMAYHQTTIEAIKKIPNREYGKELNKKV